MRWVTQLTRMICLMTSKRDERAAVRRQKADFGIGEDRPHRSSATAAFGIFTPRSSRLINGRRTHEITTVSSERLMPVVVAQGHPRGGRNLFQCGTLRTPEAVARPDVLAAVSTEIRRCPGGPGGGIHSSRRRHHGYVTLISHALGYCFYTPRRSANLLTWVWGWSSGQLKGEGDDNQSHN